MFSIVTTLKARIDGNEYTRVTTLELNHTEDGSQRRLAQAIVDGNGTNEETLKAFQELAALANQMMDAHERLSATSIPQTSVAGKKR